MRGFYGFHASLALALILSACASVTGAGGGDAAAVAEIVCQDGTRVLTPAVRVQTDGVHLRVDNRAGAERHIYKQEDPTSALDQHQAPPGISEAVSLEGPGTWHVICSRPADYPQENSAWVEFDVVDPDGLWVPDQPECEFIEGTHNDYFEDLPVGHTGDLLEFARQEVPEEMEDPQPHDVVEPAGYPEASYPQFRVARGGKVVAVAWYRDDGRGGWLFGGIDYCADVENGVLEPAD